MVEGKVYTVDMREVHPEVSGRFRAGRENSIMTRKASWTKP